MRFRFKTNKLRSLYTEERAGRRYPAEVVESFFEVMAAIAAAQDERDLRALKLLRFEKLSGDREGHRSLRLNDQWRLVLSVMRDREVTYLLIETIEDYH